MDLILLSHQFDTSVTLLTSVKLLSIYTQVRSESGPIHL